MAEQTPLPIPSDWEQMGRLAMRVEGNFWNAYYALPGTMEGAILLGSLHMGFATNPERRDQFMQYMRECVGDMIEHEFGIRPKWSGTIEAPEHEKTKNAG